MKRKIAYISGNRSEFGLIKKTLRTLNLDDRTEIQLYLIGAHLIPELGDTKSEIIEEGLPIKDVIYTFENIEKFDLGKIMAVSLEKIGEAFKKNKPDILLVVGDRYESFCAAIAGYIMKIPIVHVHGGELTQGALDDGFRHAITKLASIHFVSTEDYRTRVIQLGENPMNVHNVGGLGVDDIEGMTFSSRMELEEKYGFEFKKNNFLITYHAETANDSNPGSHFSEILKSLSLFPDCIQIFTAPAPEPGGEEILNLIEKYVNNNNNATFIKSMGKSDYFSMLRYSTAVIGNSSSGLLEAPSFQVLTLNIGQRQSGRIKANSVIDVECDAQEITAKLLGIINGEFSNKLSGLVNPYSKKNTSEIIARFLIEQNLDSFRKLPFYDLEKIN